MMQGDAYKIPIDIQLDSGPAEPTDFKEIEVQLGQIRKTLTKGQISYSPEQKTFLFPIEQEESIRIPAGRVELQVRVKLKNDEVIGTNMESIEVLPSNSKVIL